MAESRPAESGASILLGIGLAFLLHLLQLPLGVLAGFLSCLGEASNLCELGVLLPLLLIGVSQLVYQVPAVVLARRRRRFGLAKGVIIGAAITFALNAPCWAILGLGMFS